MAKLKRGVKQMIAEARAEISNHSAEEAARRVSEENALLVDVRDGRIQRLEGGKPSCRRIRAETTRVKTPYLRQYSLVCSPVDLGKA